MLTPILQYFSVWFLWYELVLVDLAFSMNCLSVRLDHTGHPVTIYKYLVQYYPAVLPLQDIVERYVTVTDWLLDVPVNNAEYVPVQTF